MREDFHEKGCFTDRVGEIPHVRFEPFNGVESVLGAECSDEMPAAKRTSRTDV
jgi:hypothetical protein